MAHNISIRNLIRSIVAMLAGIVVAILTFTLIEQLGHSIFPPPATINWNDSNAVKAFMDNQPVGSYLLVLAGWIIGSFAAAIITQKISQQSAYILPAVLSALLLASAALNFFMLPRPVWFVVAGLIVFAPSVFAGWTLSERGQGRSTGAEDGLVNMNA
jgi:hypothetical protein